ncbi:MAG: nucleoside monophosphate kinase [Clostridia bacterium]|jgi:adenylate kinase family enzyme|nr:nucleoside monophosphate kinase [Clostridia bacterium]
MSRNCISFVSAPASGKGTAIKNMEELMKGFDIKTIAIGGYIRTLKKEDKIPQDHREISKEELNKFIFERVSQDINEYYEALGERDSILVLDSFPLYPSQFAMYEDILKEFNLNELGCVTLEVDKDVLVERQKGRLICSSCDNIYNTAIESKMPPEEGICECGAELEKRKDDKDLEVMIGRIESYYKKDKVIMDYFEGKKKLLRIDGNDDEMFIAKEIVSYVNKNI